MDPMLPVTMLSLKSLSNEELAAANNAINGFGRMQKTNLAYAKLTKLALIDDSGRPSADCLANALARTVNGRVADGTFK